MWLFIRNMMLVNMWVYFCGLDGFYGKEYGVKLCFKDVLVCFGSPFIVWKLFLGL